MLLTGGLIFKGKVPAAICFSYLGAGGCQIHMTLYHMTVKPGVQPRASLQVYLISHLKQTQVRFEEGFPDGRNRIGVSSIFTTVRHTPLCEIL